MIFVSYNHKDEEWRRRFEVISKPLARAEKMRFWSDRDIKAGEWEPQIQAAMKEAVAAVLLVSDNFIASDYIIQKELPYLMKAAKTRGLMIFWAYLEPCLLDRYPEIKSFQAMRLTNELEPMLKMTPWQWKQTMVNGCGMIDEFLKGLEQPQIDRALDGKSFPTEQQIPLLVKHARRAVEVLVHTHDGKWWRQAPIKVGAKATKIYLGNAATKKGARYKIVAMTTESPLKQQTYLNLPDSRRRSPEITLIRG